MGFDLAPPALNISATYLPPGLNTSKVSQDTPIKRFLDQSQMAWVWADEYFSVKDIEALGRCQTVEVRRWLQSTLEIFLIAE